MRDLCVLCEVTSFERLVMVCEQKPLSDCPSKGPRNVSEGEDKVLLCL